MAGFIEYEIQLIPRVSVIMRLKKMMSTKGTN